MRTDDQRVFRLPEISKMAAANSIAILEEKRTFSVPGYMYTLMRYENNISDDCTQMFETSEEFTDTRISEYTLINR